MAIKGAVNPRHHLLDAGQGVLVFVVTEQVKLFVMDGLVCSFIHFTGIALLLWTEPRRFG